MIGLCTVMIEDAVVFGSGSALVGIVTPPLPESIRHRHTGVIFVNAGLVHRVGPNRLYVGLARELARRGCTCLRFDHAGIGDSPATLDERSFEQRFVDETRQAIDWLAAHRSCTRFVLVGLCSGTLIAFRTACADPRVSGLVLLTALLQDPSTVPADVVAEASDRRVARSYVTAKAGRQSTWRRALTGRANYANALRTGVRLVARTARPRAVHPDVARVVADLGDLLTRGVGILFLYGEPTTVLEYFRMTIEAEVPALARHGRLNVHILKHSDHTFSRARDQNRIAELVGTWIDESSAKTYTTTDSSEPS